MLKPPSPTVPCGWCGQAFVPSLEQRDYARHHRGAQLYCNPIHRQSAASQRQQTKLKQQGVMP